MPLQWNNYRFKNTRDTHTRDEHQTNNYATKVPVARDDACEANFRS